MLHWAYKQLAVLFVLSKVVRYGGNPFDSDALVLTPRSVDMILPNKLAAPASYRHNLGKLRTMTKLSWGFVLPRSDHSIS
jgi:hypothetical protein